MPFLSKNVDLLPALRISPWRKIAIGTWRTAGDPTVYGFVELDAAPALAYIEKLRQKTGSRITLTHFTGRAVAEVFKRSPQINCILRWGRLYPRRDVDVFFQVAADSSGEDLSGMTIRKADTKSLAEICKEMEDRVALIREKRDTSFTKMKGTMGLLPGWATRYALDFAGFLMYTLNLWSPALGSPRDPFGSVMVTNVGPLGINIGLAPLVPYSRVPLLFAMGAVTDAPVVVDGKLAVGKILPVGVTFDHRLIDGVHSAKMLKTLRAVFAEPEKELGPA